MRKQKEVAKFQELVKEGVGKSIEDRVAYNKDLEYNRHANLFAVSYSTIHKAACDGSVSGIKYFMSLRSKPRIKIDDLDKFGIRPIHYAAERGFNAAIETILSFNCPVDAPTVDGMTAMMYAGKDGRIETMRLLFEHNANLRAVNRAGMSIAHFAAQNDFVEVFGVLIELFSQQKETILKQIEEAEMNADNGVLAAKPSATGSGKPAAAGAKEEVSTPKRKSGFDSDNDDDDESLETAGTSATKRAAGGAKAQPVDEDDEDIDDAERMRRAFKDMLNLPDTAIIDIPSRNGTRPLHIAATFNAIKTVTYLVSRGADIEAVDSAGETPLHKAARRSNYDSYRVLVAAGAKEHVKNMSRETPKELLSDGFKN